MTTTSDRTIDVPVLKSITVHASAGARLPRLHAGIRQLDNAILWIAGHLVQTRAMVLKLLVNNK